MKTNNLCSRDSFLALAAIAGYFCFAPGAACQQKQAPAGETASSDKFPAAFAASLVLLRCHLKQKNPSKSKRRSFFPEVYPATRNIVRRFSTSGTPVFGRNLFKSSPARNELIASAFAAAIAAPAILSAQKPVPPPTAFKTEKCYGIAKAGKNDCASTGNNSCGGSSKLNSDPKAWIYVPAGYCDRIVGGSLQPK